MTVPIEADVRSRNGAVPSTVTHFRDLSDLHLQIERQALADLAA